MSIASMALGAFAAIGQTNIKRLMAYSSIANMGFALVGLAAGTPEGVQGVIVYMMIYMIMTLGTFACIIAMRRKGLQVEEINDLAGLSRSNKGLAFVFAMLMFSLAGIPPLAGFFAKYFVFLAAMKAGLYVLAIIGVISSVIGAYYYLRVVKIIYFDEPAEAFDAMDRRGEAGRLCGRRLHPALRDLRQSADRPRGRGRAVALLRSAAGHPVRHFERIDSTNIEARRLAEQGERGPLWLVADEQDGGRGRLGRTWVLGARKSLCHVPLSPCPPGRRSPRRRVWLRPSRCRRPSCRLRPDLAVRIKWPNDLLIGGAKFCGILSEVVGTSPTRIALGCGINVAHAPKDTPYPVTALGLRCTVESVFQELDSSLSNCLKIWDEGRGFEAIRAAWTAAALGIGGQVTAQHRRRSDIRHLRRHRAGWCPAAADRRRNAAADPFR